MTPLAASPSVAVCATVKAEICQIRALVRTDARKIASTKRIWSAPSGRMCPMPIFTYKASRGQEATFFTGLVENWHELVLAE